MRLAASQLGKDPFIDQNPIGGSGVERPEAIGRVFEHFRMQKEGVQLRIATAVGQKDEIYPNALFGVGFDGHPFENFVSKSDGFSANR